MPSRSHIQFWNAVCKRAESLLAKRSPEYTGWKIGWRQFRNGDLTELPNTHPEGSMLSRAPALKSFIVHYSFVRIGSTRVCSSMATVAADDAADAVARYSDLIEATVKPQSLIVRAKDRDAESLVKP